MEFPVDLLATVSPEALELSAKDYMSKLLYRSPGVKEALSLPDSKQININLCNVSFVPLYGIDTKQKILALFSPDDNYTAVGLYLLGRWWSAEDLLKTGDPSRTGLLEVKTPGERIVLYVLNRIIYRAKEKASDDIPFLCHREQEFAKILWKDGEAVGFYSVKPEGSLCDIYVTQCYQLPILNTIFIRKHHRGNGYALQMLEDFVSSFRKESMGLKSPLSTAMYKVCGNYLSAHPEDKELLWEVWDLGGPFQRTPIFKRLQTMDLKGDHQVVGMLNFETEQTDVPTEDVNSQVHKTLEYTEEVVENIVRIKITQEVQDTPVTTRTRSSSMKRKVLEEVTGASTEKIIRVEDIEAGVRSQLHESRSGAVRSSPIVNEAELKETAVTVTHVEVNALEISHVHCEEQKERTTESEESVLEGFTVTERTTESAIVAAEEAMEKTELLRMTSFAEIQGMNSNKEIQVVKSVEALIDPVNLQHLEHNQTVEVEIVKMASGTEEGKERTVEVTETKGEGVEEMLEKGVVHEETMASQDITHLQNTSLRTAIELKEATLESEDSSITEIRVHKELQVAGKLSPSKTISVSKQGSMQNSMQAVDRPEKDKDLEIKNAEKEKEVQLDIVRCTTEVCETIEGTYVINEDVIREKGSEVAALEGEDMKTDSEKMVEEISHDWTEIQKDSGIESEKETSAKGYEISDELQPKQAEVQSALFGNSELAAKEKAGVEVLETILIEQMVGGTEETDDQKHEHMEKEDVPVSENESGVVVLSVTKKDHTEYVQEEEHTEDVSVVQGSTKVHASHDDDVVTPDCTEPLEKKDSDENLHPVRKHAGRQSGTPVRRSGRVQNLPAEGELRRVLRSGKKFVANISRQRYVRHTKDVKLQKKSEGESEIQQKEETIESAEAVETSRDGKTTAVLDIDDTEVVEDAKVEGERKTTELLVGAPAEELHQKTATETSQTEDVLVVEQAEKEQTDKEQLVKMIDHENMLSVEVMGNTEKVNVEIKVSTDADRREMEIQEEGCMEETIPLQGPHKLESTVEDSEESNKEEERVKAMESLGEPEKEQTQPQVEDEELNNASVSKNEDAITDKGVKEPMTSQEVVKISVDKVLNTNSNREENEVAEQNKKGDKVEIALEEESIQGSSSQGEMTVIVSRSLRCRTVTVMSPSQRKSKHVQRPGKERAEKENIVLVTYTDNSDEGNSDATEENKTEIIETEDVSKNEDQVPESTDTDPGQMEVVQERLQEKEDKEVTEPRTNLFNEEHLDSTDTPGYTKKHAHGRRSHYATPLRQSVRLKGLPAEDELIKRVLRSGTKSVTATPKQKRTQHTKDAKQQAESAQHKSDVQKLEGEEENVEMVDIRVEGNENLNISVEEEDSPQNETANEKIAIMDLDNAQILNDLEKQKEITPIQSDPNTLEEQDEAPSTEMPLREDGRIVVEPTSVTTQDSVVLVDVNQVLSKLTSDGQTTEESPEEVYGELDKLASTEGREKRKEHTDGNETSIETKQSQAEDKLDKATLVEDSVPNKEVEEPMTESQEELVETSTNKVLNTDTSQEMLAEEQSQKEDSLHKVSVALDEDTVTDKGVEQPVMGSQEKQVIKMSDENVLNTDSNQEDNVLSDVMEVVESMTEHIHEQGLLTKPKDSKLEEITEVESLPKEEAPVATSRSLRQRTIAVMTPQHRKSRRIQKPGMEIMADENAVTVRVATNEDNIEETKEITKEYRAKEDAVSKDQGRVPESTDTDHGQMEQEEEPLTVTRSPQEVPGNEETETTEVSKTSCVEEKKSNIQTEAVVSGQESNYATPARHSGRFKDQASGGELTKRVLRSGTKSVTAISKQKQARQAKAMKNQGEIAGVEPEVHQKEEDMESQTRAAEEEHLEAVRIATEKDNEMLTSPQGRVEDQSIKEKEYLETEAPDSDHMEEENKVRDDAQNETGVEVINVTEIEVGWNASLQVVGDLDLEMESTSVSTLQEAANVLEKVTPEQTGDAETTEKILQSEKEVDQDLEKLGHTKEDKEENKEQENEAKHRQTEFLVETNQKGRNETSTGTIQSQEVKRLDKASVVEMEGQPSLIETPEKPGTNIDSEQGESMLGKEKSKCDGAGETTLDEESSATVTMSSDVHRSQSAKVHKDQKTVTLGHEETVLEGTTDVETPVVTSRSLRHRTVTVLSSPPRKSKRLQKENVQMAEVSKEANKASTEETKENKNETMAVEGAGAKDTFQQSAAAAQGQTEVVQQEESMKETNILQEISGIEQTAIKEVNESCHANDVHHAEVVKDVEIEYEAITEKSVAEPVKEHQEEAATEMVLEQGGPESEEMETVLKLQKASIVLVDFNKVPAEGSEAAKETSQDQGQDVSEELDEPAGTSLHVEESKGEEEALEQAEKDQADAEELVMEDITDKVSKGTSEKRDDSDEHTETEDVVKHDEYKGPQKETMPSTVQKLQGDDEVGTTEINKPKQIDEEEKSGTPIELTEAEASEKTGKQSKNESSALGTPVRHSRKLMDQPVINELTTRVLRSSTKSVKVTPHQRHTRQTKAVVQKSESEREVEQDEMEKEVSMEIQTEVTEEHKMETVNIITEGAIAPEGSIRNEHDMVPTQDMISLEAIEATMVDKTSDVHDTEMNGTEIEAERKTPEESVAEPVKEQGDVEIAQKDSGETATDSMSVHTLQRATVVLVDFHKVPPKETGTGETSEESSQSREEMKQRETLVEPTEKEQTSIDETSFETTQPQRQVGDITLEEQSNATMPEKLAEVCISEREKNHEERDHESSAEEETPVTTSRSLRQRTITVKSPPPQRKPKRPKKNELNADIEKAETGKETMSNIHDTEMKDTKIDAERKTPEESISEPVEEQGDVEMTPKDKVSPKQPSTRETTEEVSQSEAETYQQADTDETEDGVMKLKEFLVEPSEKEQTIIKETFTETTQPQEEDGLNKTNVLDARDASLELGVGEPMTENHKEPVVEENSMLAEEKVKDSKVEDITLEEEKSTAAKPDKLEEVRTSEREEHHEERDQESSPEEDTPVTTSRSLRRRTIIVKSPPQWKVKHPKKTEVQADVEKAETGRETAVHAIKEGLLINVPLESGNVSIETEKPESLLKEATTVVETMLEIHDTEMKDTEIKAERITPEESVAEPVKDQGDVEMIQKDSEENTTDSMSVHTLQEATVVLVDLNKSSSNRTYTREITEEESQSQAKTYQQADIDETEDGVMKLKEPPVEPAEKEQTKINETSTETTQPQEEDGLEARDASLELGVGEPMTENLKEPVLGENSMLAEEKAKDSKVGDITEKSTAAMLDKLEEVCTSEREEHHEDQEEQTPVTTSRSLRRRTITVKSPPQKKRPQKLKAQAGVEKAETGKEIDVTFQTEATKVVETMSDVHHTEMKNPEIEAERKTLEGSVTEPVEEQGDVEMAQKDSRETPTASMSVHTLQEASVVLVDLNKVSPRQTGTRETTEEASHSEEENDQQADIDETEDGVMKLKEFLVEATEKEQTSIKETSTEATQPHEEDKNSALEARASEQGVEEPMLEHIEELVVEENNMLAEEKLKDDKIGDIPLEKQSTAAMPDKLAEESASEREENHEEKDQESCSEEETSRSLRRRTITVKSPPQRKSKRPLKTEVQADVEKAEISKETDEIEEELLIYVPVEGGNVTFETEKQECFLGEQDIQALIAEEIPEIEFSMLQEMVDESDALVEESETGEATDTAISVEVEATTENGESVFEVKSSEAPKHENKDRGTVSLAEGSISKEKALDIASGSQANVVVEATATTQVKRIVQAEVEIAEKPNAQNVSLITAVQRISDEEGLDEEEGLLLTKNLRRRTVMVISPTRRKSKRLHKDVVETCVKEPQPGKPAVLGQASHQGETVESIEQAGGAVERNDAGISETHLKDTSADGEKAATSLVEEEEGKIAEMTGEVTTETGNDILEGVFAENKGMKATTDSAVSENIGCEILIKGMDQILEETSEGQSRAEEKQPKEKEDKGSISSAEEVEISEVEEGGGVDRRLLRKRTVTVKATSERKSKRARKQGLNDDSDQVEVEHIKHHLCVEETVVEKANVKSPAGKETMDQKDKKLADDHDKGEEILSDKSQDLGHPGRQESGGEANTSREIEEVVNEQAQVTFEEGFTLELEEEDDKEDESGAEESDVVVDVEANVASDTREEHITVEEEEPALKKKRVVPGISIAGTSFKHISTRQDKKYLQEVEMEGKSESEAVKEVVEEEDSKNFTPRRSNRLARQNMV